MAEKSLATLEPPNPPGKYPGVRLDVLFGIIADVGVDDDIKSLFGTDILKRLAVVDVKGRLRLVETGEVKLTDEEKGKLEAALKRIIHRHKEAAGGE